MIMRKGRSDGPNNSSEVSSAGSWRFRRLTYGRGINSPSNSQESTGNSSNLTDLFPTTALSNSSNTKGGPNSHLPINNNALCQPGLERPANLDLLLHMGRLPIHEQLNHTWSEQDHSNNLYITADNPMTFHRHPVAQSTDAARGKQGYNQGLHLWRIGWGQNQRGTHAVIGVGTIDAPLHANGYVTLLGSQSDNSWGWNISTNTLHYNGANISAYPSVNQQLRMSQTGHDSSSSSSYSTTYCPLASIASSTSVGNPMHNEYRAPEDIYVILDMDEGTLGFLVDGQFLGYAFRGLRGYTLYPMVSAVWGHCEVTLEYMNGLSPEPHSLMHSCRKSIRNSLEKNNLDLLLIDNLNIPRSLKNYLLYRYP